MWKMREFGYTFFHWGNVDYHASPLATESDRFEEVKKWEQQIVDVISALDGANDANLRLFEPIIALATRHKHHGFREEAEVRNRRTTDAT